MLSSGGDFPSSQDLLSILPATTGLPLHDGGAAEDVENVPGRVRVVVRIRPPFKWETRRENYTQVVRHSSHGGHHEVLLDSAQLETRQFFFDHVFGPSVTQERVFKNVARPITDYVIKGYNGTILAYGQTGTGKTYTMGILGRVTEGAKPTGRDAGVIPRSLDLLFNHIDKQKKSSKKKTWHISVSFIQIYMEEIQDLLNSSNVDLKLRESRDTGTFVQGVTEVTIQNYDEAIDVINAGLENRVMAPTLMNTTSSRSHTILTINLKQEGVNMDETLDSGMSTKLNIKFTAGLKSKLMFVDLAGSERLKLTKSDGTRLEEAKSINQSLSALGNVIAGLTDKSITHIPYRDSKLTRILQNSLGGNAFTSLIATVGPSKQSHGESLSTLLFARRCMDVLSVATVNQVIDYRELSQKLRSQLATVETNFLLRESILQAKYTDLIKELALEAGRPFEDIMLPEPAAVDLSADIGSEDVLSRLAEGMKSRSESGSVLVKRSLQRQSSTHSETSGGSPVRFDTDKAVLKRCYAVIQDIYKKSTLPVQNLVQREADYEGAWAKILEAGEGEFSSANDERRALQSEDARSPVRAKQESGQQGALITRAKKNVDAMFYQILNDHKNLMAPGANSNLVHPSIGDFDSAESFLAYIGQLQVSIRGHTDFIDSSMKLKDKVLFKAKDELIQMEHNALNRAIDLENWAFVLRYLLATNSNLRGKLQDEGVADSLESPIQGSVDTRPMPSKESAVIESLVKDQGKNREKTPADVQKEIRANIADLSKEARSAAKSGVSDDVRHADTISSKLHGGAEKFKQEEPVELESEHKKRREEIAVKEDVPKSTYDILNSIGSFLEDDAKVTPIERPSSAPPVRASYEAGAAPRGLMQKYLGRTANGTLSSASFSVQKRPSRDDADEDFDVFSSVGGISKPTATRQPVPEIKTDFMLAVESQGMETPATDSHIAVAKEPQSLPLPTSSAKHGTFAENGAKDPASALFRKRPGSVSPSQLDVQSFVESPITTAAGGTPYLPLPAQPQKTIVSEKPPPRRGDIALSAAKRGIRLPASISSISMTKDPNVRPEQSAAAQSLVPSRSIHNLVANLRGGNTGERSGPLKAFHPMQDRKPQPPSTKTLTGEISMNSFRRSRFVQRGGSRFRSVSVNAARRESGPPARDHRLRRVSTDAVTMEP